MQSKVKNLFGRQIMIPILALVALALFNLIVDPSFFSITLGYSSTGDPVLSGYLITILDYGSELAILAIGMTLVTAASGGQDISVGATMAIAGSVTLRVLCGSNSTTNFRSSVIRYSVILVTSSRVYRSRRPCSSRRRVSW